MADQPLRLVESVRARADHRDRVVRSRRALYQELPLPAWSAEAIGREQRVLRRYPRADLTQADKLAAWRTFLGR